MTRTHLVAIIVGVVLLMVVWLFVVPLLLDLGDSNGRNAALGWIVLVGATILVGWIMFRPPGFQPEVEASRIRRRQGLRRSEQQRRRNKR